jgi:hypothetical protein
MAEYIDLWWDMDDPPEYVRGHVSSQEAIEAIEAVAGTLNIDGLEYFDFNHRWARWEPANTHMRAYGCERTMMVYDEKGRGMFAVTEARRKSSPPQHSPSQSNE